jgi:hypothetical protein
MKKAIFSILLFVPIVLIGQTAQDSLLQFLTANKTTVQELVTNYKTVSFNWTQLVVTLAGAAILAVLTWKLWAKDKLTEHIKQKAQAAIESMSNLKTAKILVVSGAGSSTAFLESFFEEKKFLNVKYASDPGFTPYVIFANNEDGTLDKDTVLQMVKDDMVLFYFGTVRWDYPASISKNANFANSRAQIYGNLMSSLEFLELVKPKIKNV